MVPLSGMSAAVGPRFTDVKECSDYYSLIDLRLGAKADARTLPALA